MTPYQNQFQRALYNTKQSDRAMSEEEEPDRMPLAGGLSPYDISYGRRLPKYLNISGSMDWDGGWDNGVKILER